MEKFPKLPFTRGIYRNLPCCSDKINQITPPQYVFAHGIIPPFNDWQPWFGRKQGKHCTWRCYRMGYPTLQRHSIQCRQKDKRRRQSADNAQTQQVVHTSAGGDVPPCSDHVFSACVVNIIGCFCSVQTERQKDADKAQTMHRQSKKCTCLQGGDIPPWSNNVFSACFVNIIRSQLRFSDAYFLLSMSDHYHVWSMIHIPRSCWGAFVVICW